MLKRFGLKVVLFCLLQAAICGGFVFAAWRAPDRYIGVIQDKHRRCAAQRAPRLLLVGGSNLAFGIQSEMLGSSLRCSPVNLGLHAGLGLEFMLEDALPEVRDGDTVLVSLEYCLLGKPGPSRVLWEALLARPESIRGLDYSALSDWGLGFVAHAASRGWKVLCGRHEREHGVYDRNSFNEFGDVIAHRNALPVRRRSLFTDAALWSGETDARWLERLRRFVAGCEARGARVVIFFPPIPRSMFARDRERFQEYVFSQKALFGERVLGRLEDIPFPEEMFYDSAYHLTGAGSAMRTSMIIRRLELAVAITAMD